MNLFHACSIPPRNPACCELFAGTGGRLDFDNTAGCGKPSPTDASLPAVSNLREPGCHRRPPRLVRPSCVHTCGASRRRRHPAYTCLLSPRNRDFVFAPKTAVITLKNIKTDRRTDGLDWQQALRGVWPSHERGRDFVFKNTNASYERQPRLSFRPSHLTRQSQAKALIQIRSRLQKPGPFVHCSLRPPPPTESKRQLASYNTRTKTVNKGTCSINDTLGIR